MLSKTGGTRGESRSSALWGTGSRGGESRSNALWGRGGRGLVLAMTTVFLLGIPLVASASNGGSKASGATYIDPNLLKLANEHPGTKIPVIIQSSAGVSGAENAVDKAAKGGSLQRRLKLIGATSATIPAARLKELAKLPGLTVTSDAPMKTDGTISYSTQLWPYVTGVAALWGLPWAPAPAAPTIAVIDSGIQADRTDFTGRVVANVNLSTLPGNTTPGDGRGHGTFVAGIAAGNAPGYAGAAPNGKIAALDVMDDTGVARTSDVIAACQWILANKSLYNIRVANLSLHSSTPSNFTRDPLDRAVEQLWFNGVTVVAAAGNYGTGDTPSRVRYAPGNDPFVITVGAADLGGTFGIGDDTTAPWSAYGYTYDGFWKPEIGAPGRYMVGPVPAGSTLAQEKASNVTAPGYIQLSGTSFAAPAVAGAAAQILARHPEFTPDQVKGALMQSARPAKLVTNYSLGVGELNALGAAFVSRPANPNQALDKFVTSTSSGSGSTAYSFDAVGWADAAKSAVSWDAVAWSDVAWDDVAWDDVAWSDISWGDVSWQDVAWSDVAWGDVSWQDASYEDAAEGDAASTSDAYALNPDDAAALEADPVFKVSPDVIAAAGADAPSSQP
jgi:serine protease AprX